MGIRRPSRVVPCSEGRPLRRRLHCFMRRLSIRVRIGATQRKCRIMGMLRSMRRLLGDERGKERWKFFHSQRRLY